MGFYENRILPHIIDWACGMEAIRRQRGKLIPRAAGRVLEIGMGSGHNLSLYDPAKVELVWGLEPAEGMRRLAAPAVRRAPFEVRFLDLPGERIPLDDDSADTVVTTFTLCTIPGAPLALQQIRRVLRPGGALLFLEHGRAPDEAVQRWQRRVEPTWKTLFGGCHLTRPIPQLIEDAGFRVLDLEAAYADMGMSGGPAALKIASFEYLGAAAIA